MCLTDFRIWEDQYFYYPAVINGLDEGPRRPEQAGMAVLSEDITILFGNDDSLSEGNNQNVWAVRVLDTSGTTINQVNSVVVPQDDVLNEHVNRAACRISDTRFVLLYERYDNVVPGDPMTFDRFIAAVLCDIDPVTYAITFHNYAIAYDTWLIQSAHNYVDPYVVVIDTNKILVTVIYDSILRGRIGTISGNSISFGFSFTILDNLQSFSFTDNTYTVFTGLENGLWAGLVYAGSPVTANVGEPSEWRYGAYLVTGNATGTGIDFMDLGPGGDWSITTWVYAGTGHLGKLSGNEAFITYYYENFDDHENPEFPADGAWPQVTLLTQVVTVSTAGQISSLSTQQRLFESTVDFGFTNGEITYGGFFDGYAPNTFLMSGEKFIIESSVTTYHQEWLMVLTVDAGVTTVDSYCDIPYKDAPIFSIPTRALLHRGNGQFLQMFSEGGNYWREISLYTIGDVLACCILYDNVYLLGISTVGSTVYVTAWADNQLILNVIDLSTGIQLDSIFISSASLAEVIAKTQVAYPLAFSDSTVMVYGRMLTPVGLSHIMYSEDAGGTFTILENSWGVDYVGSIAAYALTDYYAMRCNALSSKLYHGNLDTLEIRSTLPFSGPIEPHGLRVSPWDEAMLAAVKRDSQAQTVIYSYPPYLAWSDVTLNHPQTAVNAVVPL